MMSVPGEHVNSPHKPLLTAKGVHAWLGNAHVLRGVDLEIQRGEVVAIIGPSGSGKTTFLRCINSLVRYSGGALSVDGELVGYELRGHRLYERRERELARARSRIGMVFQHFNLFPHMTIRENVAYGPRRVLKVPRADAIARAERVLCDVGLKEHMHKRPANLSGGQQQRVGIARALAMEPMMLLFDEPTSSLDRELVGEVLAVIKRVAASGTTMIIVTHELNFARDVADRVIFMDDGHVIEAGPAATVLDSPREPRTRQFLGLEGGNEAP